MTGDRMTDDRMTNTQPSDTGQAYDLLLTIRYSLPARCSCIQLCSGKMIEMPEKT